ncbi:MAG: DUF177 domain-containing protein [Actinomycetota bacterium]|nr:DUF177 domain-containing protein [Actinomycetota bacterium]
MKPHYVDVTKILDHPGEELAFSGAVELEPTKLGAELIEFPLPSDVDVILSSVSHAIVITGKALGRFRLRCSRCLEKFDFEAAVDIEELAMAEAAEPGREDVFPLSAGRIDLAAVVYQNIIVEVPIQPLCRQACAGLCAVCGKNLSDEPHNHPGEEGDEHFARLKEYFQRQRKG